MIFKVIKVKNLLAARDSVPTLIFKNIQLDECVYFRWVFLCFGPQALRAEGLGPSTHSASASGCEEPRGRPEVIPTCKVMVSFPRGRNLDVGYSLGPEPEGNQGDCLSRSEVKPGGSFLRSRGSQAALTSTGGLGRLLASVSRPCGFGRT